jgi:hypothetical protein
MTKKQAVKIIVKMVKNQETQEDKEKTLVDATSQYIMSKCSNCGKPLR